VKICEQRAVHASAAHRPAVAAHPNKFDHLDLIRCGLEVNNLSHLRVEAFQRTAWKLGIECPRGRVPCGEIIEQRARERRLADAALVGAYQDHSWLH